MRLRRIVVALFDHLEIGAERLLVTALALQLVALPVVRVVALGAQRQPIAAIATCRQKQEQPQQPGGQVHSAKQTPHGDTGMGLNAGN